MKFWKTDLPKIVFQKAKSASRPHHDLPTLVPTMDNYQQADFVLSIQSLYDSGINYDDIAILYRAHFHAMELQVNCRVGGFPLL